MLYFANWKVLLICAICALGVICERPEPVQPGAAGAFAACHPAQAGGARPRSARRLVPAARGRYRRRPARPPQHDRRERAQRVARRQDRLYRARCRRGCDRLHDPRRRPDRRCTAGPRQDRPGAHRRDRQRRDGDDAVSARSRPKPAAPRRSSSRSRSSAGASTRPAPRSRRSSARDRTASWSSFPGSIIPSTSRRCLGRTAKLTFQLVDTSVRSRRRGAAACRRATRSSPPRRGAATAPVHRPMS